MNSQNKSTKTKPESQEHNFVKDENLCGIQKVFNKEKQIEDLALCLNDLIDIDKGVKTLLMYLFGAPYMKSIDAGTVEFHKEEANEIHDAILAQRKFQRLLDLVKPIDDDPYIIGIAFKELSL